MSTPKPDVRKKSDVFCRQIYVGSSRQRISGTPSNFRYSLVRNVVLPKNCAAFVSDVTLPHTWTNVDPHANALHWGEWRSSLD